MQFDLKNITVLGLVIVCVVLALNAGTKQMVVTSGGDGAAANTITVSGSHEMSVDPDKAVLYIAIQTGKQTAKSAQLENADITNDVRSALIATKKVDKDDIETYNFNLYEKYEYDEFKRKNVAVGYELMHTLKVTTYDIEGTGDLIDEAIREGANKVDRVSFGLKDETQDKYYATALQEAAKNSESKAKTLAGSLNVKLGGISKVSESSVNFVAYDTRSFAVAEMAKVGETSISPQSVQVNANVNVAYNIG
ncbi:SIMPL domain-containing protein [Nanoarchaeota archaeon]